MNSNYDFQKDINKGKFFNINFKKLPLSIYFSIFIALTYIPLIIMVVFAFNSGKSVQNWDSASLQWFNELFNDSQFMAAIGVSLIVSITSTFFSLILGTFAAIGLSKNGNLWLSKILSSVTNYPIFAAEIVMGVSLMIMFITFGITFGIGTLVISHIMFCTPYVIISVLPRLKQLDKELINASFDLGAKPSKTLFKVILPNIKGAMFVGAGIAFAMSFDDFMISYLTSGSVETASTYIYSLKRITPIVNAFGSIVLFIVVISIISIFIYTIRNDKKINWEEEIIKKNHKTIVKSEYKNEIRNNYKNLNLREKKEFKKYLNNNYNLILKSNETSSSEIIYAKNVKYFNNNTIAVQKMNIQLKSFIRENKISYIQKRNLNKLITVEISKNRLKNVLDIDKQITNYINNAYKNMEVNNEN